MEGADLCASFALITWHAHARLYEPSLPLAPMERREACGKRFRLTLASSKVVRDDKHTLAREGGVRSGAERKRGVG